ncbi:MAG TPA: bifunctional 5,10-methylenetetrahydrofolate dehydrogenase/5,10-methenyltetrahydrofolate cyclohydrolase [Candidatus Saccharimonadales bacterium]
MAKLLDGSELVGYIKERQARQVRALRQAHHVFPKLAIVKSTTASDVIDVYVRMKQRYGDDILIETVIETLDEADMPAAIARLNADDSVHGIIIQLPLADPSKTDEIVNLVAPEKDVDGLSKTTDFDSATAGAINWLLAGYGIDLGGKKIAIVGNGRLVGAPLAKMWTNSGYSVTVLDNSSEDIASVIRESDVVVSATGAPRLITASMINVGAVVVDAGTASENGVIVGDIEPAIRERDDVKVTPEKGGVGPLTIAALFDHVIEAALKVAAAKNTN